MSMNPEEGRWRPVSRSQSGSRMRDFIRDRAQEDGETRAALHSVGFHDGS
jgi:hypothetical protein